MIPAALLVVALLAAGCGDDGNEVAVPTPEELASSLVEPANLDGDWTVSLPPEDVPPEDAEAAASGVITEAQSGLLPSLELCEEAGPEAIAAAEDLTWMAFRQLDLAPDDPIDPPDDRSGHMVFLQEFLTADDPDATTATFELLRDGLTACLGDIPAGEEGPGTATTMPLPDVGDDRFGTLVTIEEAGGWAEWRLHSALVRQDAVLMSIVIVDIRAGEGVEPFFYQGDIDTIVQTITDRV